MLVKVLKKMEPYDGPFESQRDSCFALECFHCAKTAIKICGDDWSWNIIPIMFFESQRDSCFALEDIIGHPKEWGRFLSKVTFYGEASYHVNGDYANDNPPSDFVPVPLGKLLIYPNTMKGGNTLMETALQFLSPKIHKVVSHWPARLGGSEDDYSVTH
jgi:hypothetical protein